MSRNETSCSLLLSRDSWSAVNHVSCSWVFIYEKSYQVKDTGIESSVMTKVKGYGDLNGQVMDVADYVFPQQVCGARTNRSMTFDSVSTLSRVPRQWEVWWWFEVHMKKPAVDDDIVDIGFEFNKLSVSICPCAAHFDCCTAFYKKYRI